MKKLFKFLAIGVGSVIALLLLIGFLAGGSGSDSSGKPESAVQAAKPAADAPLLKVTAREFSQDYEDNTVAADAKYKGIRFHVNGKITDINTDILGNPYVAMVGANQFMGPQFSFKDSTPKEKIALLKKGQQIAIVCTGRGDIAKTAMAEECEFTEP